MAGTAGYSADLYITATDTTPGGSDQLCTIDLGAELGRAMLDDTCHGGDGAVSRVAGLFDSSISHSLVYNASSASQLVVENAVLSGVTLYAHYRPTGVSTRQWKIPVKVESFSISSAVGDLVTADVTLQGVGLPTFTTS